MLSCISPSTGIKLQGIQSSNTICATLNIELDTSTCLIDTTLSSSSDIIWFHPTCTNNLGNNCVMYLGNNTNSNLNYSLTNLELNTINTSSLETLYLGDRYLLYILMKYNFY